MFTNDWISSVKYSVNNVLCSYTASVRKEEDRARCWKLYTSFISCFLRVYSQVQILLALVCLKTYSMPYVASGTDRHHKYSDFLLTWECHIRMFCVWFQLNIYMWTTRYIRNSLKESFISWFYKHVNGAAGGLSSDRPALCMKQCSP